MKEGGIKKGMGCFTIPFALIVLPIALFLVILPFFMVKTVWLYASCNTHFYGRVASSITADILSKQFGKTDKVYTTNSEGGSGLQGFIKSNVTQFRRKFLQADRPARQPLSTPPASRFVSLSDYYQTVRNDIDQLLK